MRKGKVEREVKVEREREREEERKQKRAFVCVCVQEFGEDGVLGTKRRGRRGR